MGNKMDPRTVSSPLRRKAHACKLDSYSAILAMSRKWLELVEYVVVCSDDWWFRVEGLLADCAEVADFGYFNNSNGLEGMLGKIASRVGWGVGANGCSHDDPVGFMDLK